MCSWFSLSQSLYPLTTWKCVPQWICLMVCYGRDEMACHLHPILCTWDAVTTCTPVTVFLPLGVRLWKKIHGKKSGIQLGFEFKTFWILNIIIHERFLLLSVNNIKPLNFHHQPWSWLLGLLGGLCVTTGPAKVANFNQGSTSVQPWESENQCEFGWLL